jgi:hypothetical protein
MVDIVVHRHKLRETVARLCRLFMKLPPPNYPHGDEAWEAEEEAAGNGADTEIAVDEAPAEEPAEETEQGEQQPTPASS